MSYLFFFFKQKTAYEMRISDWSSDVCSSDLPIGALRLRVRNEDGLDAVVASREPVETEGKTVRLRIESHRRAGTEVFDVHSESRRTVHADRLARPDFGGSTIGGAPRRHQDQPPCDGLACRQLRQCDRNAALCSRRNAECAR